MDCSLLATLSPELRNIIWSFVLATTSPLVINDRSTAAPHALTATCRQIRRETLLMFYAGHTIQLHLPCSADSGFHPEDETYERILRNTSQWLRSLDSTCHRLIKCFEVHVPVDKRVIPLGHRDTESDYDVFTRVMAHKRLRATHLPTLVKLLAQHGYRGERQPRLVYLTNWAFEPFEWIAELRKREAEDMGFRPDFASDAAARSRCYGCLAEGSLSFVRQQWLL